MQNMITVAMYSTNLRKTWQTINETLNRTKEKRDFPPEFRLAKGNIISDLKKLQMLNDFFFSIGDIGLFDANKNVSINICH